VLELRRKQQLQLLTAKEERIVKLQKEKSRQHLSETGTCGIGGSGNRGGGGGRFGFITLNGSEVMANGADCNVESRDA